MEDQKLSFVESGHLFVTKMTKAFGSVLAKFYYLTQGNIDSYLSVMKVGLRARERKREMYSSLIFYLVIRLLPRQKPQYDFGGINSFTYTSFSTVSSKNDEQNIIFAMCYVANYVLDDVLFIFFYI